MAETALSPLDRCDPAYRDELEAILALRAEDLPCLDGKTVPATLSHLRALAYNFGGLEAHFRGRPVQVAADVPLWYVRFGADGRPKRRHVSPDVSVVFGIEPRYDLDRHVVWRDGKAPDFVLEALSPSTWRRDLHAKRRIYAAMGVREYFLFDATGKCPAPPLSGFALSGGVYRAVPAERLPNGEPGLASRVLGLSAYCRRPRTAHSRQPTGPTEFRWYDPVAGKDIPTRAELEDRVAEEAAARRAEALGRRTEAAARQAEANARRAAEKRILELEALLAEKTT